MDCTALIGWIPPAVQYPSAAQWEHNTVQGRSAYSLGLNTGTKQWPPFRKSIRQNQAASDQPAVTTGWTLVARWSGGLFSSYVFRFRKGVELWILHVFEPGYWLMGTLTILFLVKTSTGILAHFQTLRLERQL
jgi:hypothetical protein